MLPGAQSLVQAREGGSGGLPVDFAHARPSEATASDGLVGMLAGFWTTGQECGATGAGREVSGRVRLP